jgi:hypothetical protein
MSFTLVVAPGVELDELRGLGAQAPVDGRADVHQLLVGVLQVGAPPDAGPGLHLLRDPVGDLQAMAPHQPLQLHLSALPAGDRQPQGVDEELGGVERPHIVEAHTEVVLVEARVHLQAVLGRLQAAVHLELGRVLRRHAAGRVPKCVIAVDVEDDGGLAFVAALLVAALFVLLRDPLVDLLVPVDHVARHVQTPRHLDDHIRGHADVAPARPAVGLGLDAVAPGRGPVPDAEDLAAPAVEAEGLREQRKEVP